MFILRLMSLIANQIHKVGRKCRQTGVLEWRQAEDVFVNALDTPGKIKTLRQTRIGTQIR
jgi:hypothetical protein